MSSSTLALSPKRSRTTVCAQCPLAVTQLQPVQDICDPVTAGVGCNYRVLWGIFIKLSDDFLLQCQALWHALFPQHSLRHFLLYLYNQGQFVRTSTTSHASCRTDFNMDGLHVVIVPQFPSWPDVEARSCCTYSRPSWSCRSFRSTRLTAPPLLDHLETFPS